MSGEKNNTWSTALLELVFQNIAAANIGASGGLQPSSPAGSLYISLHTSDPGITGDQTSNEVTTGAYAGYTRVGVVRDNTHWTVSGSTSAQVVNANAITFPQCTGGSGATITYMAVGTASSGTGEILYSGPLTSSLAVSNNITPSFASSSLVVRED